MKQIILGAFVSVIVLMHGIASAAPVKLEVVKRFPDDFAMIGVGVDAQGTVFASAPATIRRYSASVVRVDPKTGTLEPFPNASWNRFEQEPGKRQEWVSVPALWVDDDNRLWVLDSSLESVDQTKLPPKLVEFDPTSGKLLRSYVFDHDIKPSDSLNDVRVDTKARTAYISNEHGRGGLVVLNLDTGVYRLVLDKTPSGMADPNQHLHIYGELVRLMNGKLPVTQDDGIALSADRAWVYYLPLTDHKYWRISASILRDFHNSSKKIEQAVQYLGESVMSGGIEIDRCNRIWAGDLEHHSLYMLMLNKAGNGLDTTLIYHDPKVLDWADGFAISGEWLYISDSRLDQIIFRNKNGLTKQTAILRMRLPACEVQK